MNKPFDFELNRKTYIFIMATAQGWSTSSKKEIPFESFYTFKTKTYWMGLFKCLHMCECFFLYACRYVCVCSILVGSLYYISYLVYILCYNIRIQRKGYVLISFLLYNATISVNQFFYYIHSLSLCVYCCCHCFVHIKGM